LLDHSGQGADSLGQWQIACTGNVSSAAALLYQRAIRCLEVGALGGPFRSRSRIPAVAFKTNSTRRHRIPKQQYQQMIRNRDQLVAAKDRVMSPRLREVVAESSFEAVFVRDKGMMLGDGARPGLPQQDWLWTGRHYCQLKATAPLQWFIGEAVLLPPALKAAAGAGSDRSRSCLIVAEMVP
jgi:hypothetical protein